MESLLEYPDAKAMLEEKGREILMKDGLLDLDPANIKPEVKELEEKVNKLYGMMELMQTKLKKILGKYKDADKALKHRIADLEHLLGEEVEAEEEEGQAEPEGKGLEEEKGDEQVEEAKEDEEKGKETKDEEDKGEEEKEEETQEKATEEGSK